MTWWYQTCRKTRKLILRIDQSEAATDCWFVLLAFWSWLWHIYACLSYLRRQNEGLVSVLTIQDTFSACCWRLSVKSRSLITHDVRNWQWNIEEIPIWSTSTATIHGWDKCSFTSVANPSNQRTQMKPVLLPCHHWSPNDSLTTCCINRNAIERLWACWCDVLAGRLFWKHMATHAEETKGKGHAFYPLSIINIYIRWQCIATVDWPGLKHLSYLRSLDQSTWRYH